LQRLADRQRDFAEAILDVGRAMPWGLVGPDRIASSRRFAVYRNNVVAGLIKTLKDNYPAVWRIVGDDFFRAMAAPFVTTHPPRSPIMLNYGARFAEFIESFAPAATLPYLADVARIERAWIEAYHAADAAPLAASDFRAIEPSKLGDVRLVLHPSLRVTQSPYPALTIWRMNIAGGEPQPVDLGAGGEDCLIVRPDAEVHVHPLPEGAAQFIAALVEGHAVVAAVIAALEITPHFGLKDVLAGLVSAGAIAGWSFGSAPQIQCMEATL
jgi:hypothetical protein